MTVSLGLGMTHIHLSIQRGNSYITDLSCLSKPVRFGRERLGRSMADEDTLIIAKKVYGELFSRECKNLDPEAANPVCIGCCRAGAASEGSSPRQMGASYSYTRDMIFLLVEVWHRPL